MEQWDAIIVGGGPAGSTLAWKLTAAGWRVLVLDRARFPREKLCAGWITPPVLDALELDPREYASQYTLQPFWGFNASRLSGRPILADYGRPISYGIIRSEFDHYLLRRSAATVREGVRVAGIERQGGGWLINRLHRSPLLIGAGGHFCPVARYLGVKLGREKKLATLELEFKLTEPEAGGFPVAARYPELAYFDDIRGYGWIFRKGPYLNIGVGRTQHRHLKRYLITFLDEMRSRGRIPPWLHLDLGRFRGHPYKLHFVTPRRWVDDGTLLIGDAAGLSFNYSGEGIRPAVESALMAWQTLRSAQGTYDRDRLEPYRRSLEQAYGRPLTGWRFRLMEALPPFLFQSVGRMIFASSALTRNLLVDRLFLRRPWPQEPVVGSD